MGPASETKAAIGELLLAGVDVFRLNLKHNSLAWHRETIKKIREVALEQKKSCGIMADIQGPELRIEVSDGKPITIKAGEEIWLESEFRGEKSLVINNPEIIKQIKQGKEAYIDNGKYHFLFSGDDDKGIKLRAENDSVILGHKNINVPGISLDLPLFSEKDLEILKQLDSLDVDFLALSFVRSKDDVEQLKQLVKEKGLDIKIIAKIENAAAIKNLDSIIDAAYGVMVARGDLGVEIPLRQLAFWQKVIISLCRKKRKPVIVATQMLLSMVSQPRPTRAEATDVANAVYDASDALMLSEETAIGMYPIKTVTEMVDICRFAEEYGQTTKVDDQLDNETKILGDCAASIIRNRKDYPIKAVVVFSQGGETARILARYRFKIPIIAITNRMQTYRILQLSYGVIPYYKQFKDTQFDKSNSVFKEIMEFGTIKPGDNLIVIHGNDWFNAGSTSDLSLIGV